MKRKRRMCYVCGEKRARLLRPKAPYAHAIKEAVFCSVRCAADWALLQANVSGENDLLWCPKHGWTEGTIAYGGCQGCAFDDPEEGEA